MNSLVKSFSVLPGIFWCGVLYMIQYSLKNNLFVLCKNFNLGTKKLKKSTPLFMASSKTKKKYWAKYN